MTHRSLVALMLGALLFAGCGDSAAQPKKGKQGPYPVQRPNVPPVQPAGGTPTQPVEPIKHTGNVDDVKPTPPPVKPPDPPPPVSGNKKGINPGDDAPELVLEDADGKVFMLSSFRGKQPVLIVFGATW